MSAAEKDATKCQEPVREAGGWNRYPCGWPMRGVGKDEWGREVPMCLAHIEEWQRRRKEYRRAARQALEPGR